MEKTNNSMLDLAEAQFTGFVYGKHDNILGLVESMGLTKEEWLLLKNTIDISENDKDFIDNYFNI